MAALGFRKPLCGKIPVQEILLLEGNVVGVEALGEFVKALR